jgi:hypothetical protein
MKRETEESVDIGKNIIPKERIISMWMYPRVWRKGEQRGNGENGRRNQRRAKRSNTRYVDRIHTLVSVLGSKLII